MDSFQKEQNDESMEVLSGDPKKNMENEPDVVKDGNQPEIKAAQLPKPESIDSSRMKFLRSMSSPPNNDDKVSSEGAQEEEMKTDEKENYANRKPLETVVDSEENTGVKQNEKCEQNENRIDLKTIDGDEGDSTMSEINDTNVNQSSSEGDGQRTTGDLQTFDENNLTANLEEEAEDNKEEDCNDENADSESKDGKVFVTVVACPTEMEEGEDTESIGEGKEVVNEEDILISDADESNSAGSSSPKASPSRENSLDDNQYQLDDESTQSFVNLSGTESCSYPEAFSDAKSVPLLESNLDDDDDANANKERNVTSMIPSEGQIEHENHLGSPDGTFGVRPPVTTHPNQIRSTTRMEENYYPVKGTQFQNVYPTPNQFSPRQNFHGEGKHQASQFRDFHSDAPHPVYAPGGKSYQHGLTPHDVGPHPQIQHPNSQPQFKTRHPVPSQQPWNPIMSPITQDLGRIVSLHSKAHKILFHISGHEPINPTSLKWRNSSFVPIPCSPENQKLWDKIEFNLIKLKGKCESGVFNQNPSNIRMALMKTILSYNNNSFNSDFKLLSRSADLSRHIVSTIPIIVEMALNLPQLLSCPIPVLSADTPKTLYLTKRLCSSILANAFLCTFPDPMEDMPDFNFIRLFDLSLKPEKGQVKGEKLMCFLNYFHQMRNCMLSQRGQPEHMKIENCIVSFERRCFNKKTKPNWKMCSKPLIPVEVDSSGKIEEKEEMLQVDFANKIVGGGVLGNGTVMEEIRFSICPELIVARLFTAPLDDHEVLFVVGSQQFSNHSGYAASFRYTGPQNQFSMMRDNLNRMKPNVVCMDALHFKQTETSNQFKKKLVDRELRKCAIAFRCETLNAPVATGNWGCGAFNGDPELKFLLQWIASSEADREYMCYHTVGEENQERSINQMVKFIQEHGIDVKTLYKLVVSFYGEHFHCDFIFDFVVHKVKTGRVRNSIRNFTNFFKI